jgi:hypothetical protein
MQTPTLIRPLAAAILCGLTLAACGSDDPEAASGSTDREQANREAMLAYASCMRENGVDMPDPEPGQRGIRLNAPEGVTPEEMEAAESECRKHLDAIEPPDMSEEQQKEFQEAALAHARCMREHGVDMPDPTFGEDGRAQIRIQKGSGASGPDPDDPKWKAAEEACRDKLPAGRGGEASTEEAP